MHREHRTCTKPGNNREPKPSLNTRNTSIRRIQYSIHRSLRKGSSSTWPSDWDQSVHIIHSEAERRVKPSSQTSTILLLLWRRGLVLHLEVQYGSLVFGSVRLLPAVDMAGEVGIAPEGQGNYQAIRQKELQEDSVVAEYILSLLWLLRIGHFGLDRIIKKTPVEPDRLQQRLQEYMNERNPSRDQAEGINPQRIAGAAARWGRPRLACLGPVVQSWGPTPIDQSREAERPYGSGKLWKSRDHSICWPCRSQHANSTPVGNLHLLLLAITPVTTQGFDISIPLSDKSARRDITRGKG